MTRLNKILVGMLVVQLVLVLLVRAGRDDSGQIARLRPLLKDFSKSAVSGVIIDGADSKTDHVELTRRGEKWFLSSHFEYPVDAARVDALLDQVAAMQTRGIIASTKERHGQLEVSDAKFRRKLILKDTEGTTVLWVGGTAGARKTAVRIGDAASVFGVPGFSSSTLRTSPSGWVDPSFINIDRNTVHQLVVKNENGEFVFTKSGERYEPTVNGVPIAIPEGKEINYNAIDAVLRQALAVRLKSPADPTTVVVPAAATITVYVGGPGPSGVADGGPAATTDGGVPAVVGTATSWSIGPEKDSDRVVALAGDLRRVLVPGTQLAKLVGLNAEALVTDEGKGTPPKAPPGMPAGMPPGVGNPLPPGIRPPSMPPR